MDADTIVVLRSRTGKTEEFMHNSRVYIVDVKKGLRVQRFIAELGLRQNALRWNPGHGGVDESLLYIEDDLGTPEETPRTPITAKEIEEIKQTDGLGEDSIMINGQLVKKTRINLSPRKENYAGNNM